MVNLETTNWLLGVMAVVSVAPGADADRRRRRRLPRCTADARRTVTDLEARQIAPLREKVDAILDRRAGDHRARQPADRARRPRHHRHDRPGGRDRRARARRRARQGRPGDRRGPRRARRDHVAADDDRAEPARRQSAARLHRTRGGSHGVRIRSVRAGRGRRFVPDGTAGRHGARRRPRHAVRPEGGLRDCARSSSSRRTGCVRRPATRSAGDGSRPTSRRPEKVSQIVDRGREAYDRARSSVSNMPAAGTSGDRHRRRHHGQQRRRHARRGGRTALERAAQATAVRVPRPPVSMRK